MGLTGKLTVSRAGKALHNCLSMKAGLAPPAMTRVGTVTDASNATGTVPFPIMALSMDKTSSNLLTSAQF